MGGGCCRSADAFLEAFTHAAQPSSQGIDDWAVPGCAWAAPRSDRKTPDQCTRPPSRADHGTTID
eukprot:13235375-Alexandrium_andersonii.AAC.1